MASKSRWPMRFLRHNPGLKILALVLAAISFYAIRGATSDEQVLVVPLEITAAPGIAILDQDARTVRVTFRGSRDDLRLLDQGQIKAVAEAPAQDHAESSTRLSLGAGNIEGVKRVRVVEVWPGSVNLTFDHEIERMVPVHQPTTVGVPLAGKADVTYTPHSVSLRGPKRRLDLVHSVSTEKVDVEGRAAPFSQQVRVLCDPWVFSVEPAEITVTVEIVTETATRSMTNVPVRAVVSAGTKSAATIDPPTVNVDLTGPSEKLDTIVAQSVRVFVDCTELNEGVNYTLPVIVYLPASPDVIASVQPETVKIVLGSAPGSGGG